MPERMEAPTTRPDDEAAVQRMAEDSERLLNATQPPLA
jgi:hypothetical protein